MQISANIFRGVFMRNACIQVESMVMDEGDTLFEGGFDSDMDAIVRSMQVSHTAVEISR